MQEDRVPSRVLNSPDSPSVRNDASRSRLPRGATTLEAFWLYSGRALAPSM
jgi:hypothetical protein